MILTIILSIMDSTYHVWHMYFLLIHEFPAFICVILFTIFPIIIFYHVSDSSLTESDPQATSIVQVLKDFEEDLLAKNPYF